MPRRRAASAGLPWRVLPFAAVLLCIALRPPAAPRWREHDRNQALRSALLGAPLIARRASRVLFLRGRGPAGAGGKRGRADPFSANVGGVRWALLADIHANLEALQACLEHAGRQGAEAYAFVGDLIGYGADPAAVIDIVEGHARRGAVVVRGNHDAAALADSADTMNPAAAKAVLWTRRQLGPQQLAFLDSLPLTARREDILFVHASAASPGQWTYVTDPARAADSLEMSKGATWVFSGHVHEPALYFASGSGRPVPFKPKAGITIPVEGRRRWLAIIGSAGQPRDGRLEACWALFDDVKQTLAFHRVPYDWSQAAAKVRAAGLPERLAHRLEHGE